LSNATCRKGPFGGSIVFGASTAALWQPPKLAETFVIIASILPGAPPLRGHGVSEARRERSVADYSPQRSEVGVEGWKVIS